MRKREELFDTRDESFNVIERGDQIPIRTLNLLLYSAQPSDIGRGKETQASPPTTFRASRLMRMPIIQRGEIRVHISKIEVQEG